MSSSSSVNIESRYDVPRIRHALSIEDFEREKISLGTKLAFLRQNGLKFFADVVDTDLRNSVAHLDFKIDELDGRIYCKAHGKFKQIDIDERIKDFRDTVANFELFLIESGMFGIMEKQAQKETDAQ